MWIGTQHEEIDKRGSEISCFYYSFFQESLFFIKKIFILIRFENSGSYRREKTTKLKQDQYKSKFRR